MVWGGAANSKLTQTQAAIDAIENGQIFGKGIGESWVNTIFLMPIQILFLQQLRRKWFNSNYITCNFYI